MDYVPALPSQQYNFALWFLVAKYAGMCVLFKEMPYIQIILTHPDLFLKSEETWVVRTPKISPKRVFRISLN